MLQVFNVATVLDYLCQKVDYIDRASLLVGLAGSFVRSLRWLWFLDQYNLSFIIWQRRSTHAPNIILNFWGVKRQSSRSKHVLKIFQL